MLGLLDRATKLTSSQREKREYFDPRLKLLPFPAGAIAFMRNHQKSFFRIPTLVQLRWLPKPEFRFATSRSFSQRER